MHQFHTIAILICSLLLASSSEGQDVKKAVRAHRDRVVDIKEEHAAELAKLEIRFADKLEAEMKQAKAELAVILDKAMEQKDLDLANVANDALVSMTTAESQDSEKVEGVLAGNLERIVKDDVSGKLVHFYWDITKWQLNEDGTIRRLTSGNHSSTTSFWKISNGKLQVLGADKESVSLEFTGVKIGSEHYLIDRNNRGNRPTMMVVPNSK